MSEVLLNIGVLVAVIVVAVIHHEWRMHRLKQWKKENDEKR
jgi:post-segregation antitoxin (ccd killing protein)